ERAVSSPKIVIATVLALGLQLHASTGHAACLLGSGGGTPDRPRRTASRRNERRNGTMNRRHIISAVVGWLATALSAQAITLRCPPDSVKVGNTCVDTYEASLWQIDPANTTLVRKVQTGRVTLADLQAGGAIPLSPSACIAMNVFTNFPRAGKWTAVPGSNPPSPGVYAVSVAGVQPSRCITWFQANQACLLSGKRLLTNREWQGAAASTPDPGAADDRSTTCVTTGAGPANTGSRSSCKSVWGAFDMIENVDEWVADWGDNSVSCSSCPATLRHH